MTDSGDADSAGLHHSEQVARGKELLSIIQGVLLGPTTSSSSSCEARQDGGADKGPLDPANREDSQEARLFPSTPMIQPGAALETPDWLPLNSNQNAAALLECHPLPAPAWPVQDFGWSGVSWYPSYTPDQMQQYESWQYDGMDYNNFGGDMPLSCCAGTSAKPEAAAGTTAATSGETPKTTVLLRNLPSDYTVSSMLELLEDEGFEGCYDFVYVPMDFGSRLCLGYALVNFVSESDVARCWKVFEGLCDWGKSTSTSRCEVTWSEPHQGLRAHMERYQNSPVMHESVPDEWKPALFTNGVRIPFPPPTKKIKAPAMKGRSKVKGQRHDDE